MLIFRTFANEKKRIAHSFCCGKVILTLILTELRLPVLLIL